MKQRLKTACISGLVIAFSLAALAPVIVLAEGTSGQASESKTYTEEQLKEKARLKAEKAAAEAKAQAEKARAAKAQNRQKSCEARQDGLEKRMRMAVSQAEKHKGVFDKAFERVKAYHDREDLGTPNYDTLVNAANAAGANAGAAIASLKAFNTDVDCANEKVAGSVTAFKEELRATRDSLKEYRKAITELIKAVKLSAPSGN